MALLFQKPVEHAIRGLIYLAIQEESRPVSIEEIAEVEGIPRHHLSIIMRKLAAAGLVASVRDPRKGFRLARDPAEISLWDLVSILGCPNQLDECGMGWELCRTDSPCPLHDRWTGIMEMIRSYLQDTTIEHLASVSLEKDQEKFPQVFSI